MIFKLRIIFWNNYSPRLVYIFRFHTKACLTPVSISFSTTVEIVEEFSAILVRIIRCLFLLLPNQYEFATLATRLFCKDTRGDSPRCYQSAHPLWSMRKLNPPATWTSMEFLVTRRPTFCSIFQEYFDFWNQHLDRLLFKSFTMYISLSSLHDLRSFLQE